MNWKEVLEIASFKDEDNNNLFSIESHTHTHSCLGSKKEGESDDEYAERILTELTISQEVINKQHCLSYTVFLSG